MPVDDLVLARWDRGDAASVRELAGMLAAYHLATEAEKGAAVASVDELPPRYRDEVADPVRALASATVLTAAVGGAGCGCVVVSPVAEGTSEVRRLWVGPAARGRGVGRALVDAAVAAAGARGVGVVRLSVWRWRTAAIAVYERAGFVPVPSWDARPDLTCMELRLPGT
ncbi:GNAT family N-acetyltransferase [Geodermatophilus sp. SYSU D00684]